MKHAILPSFLRVLFLFPLIFTLHAHSQEWVRQHPFEGFAPLHAITFDDQGNGWAVGQNSLILHTANWGELWTIQAGLPIGYTFEAVEIIPGTNAQTVLIGGPGLFRTDDGGTHWSFQPIGGTLDGVFRIQAFDAMHWVASGLSTFAKTSDGGQNWEILDMPDNTGRGTWFNDLDHGWTGSGNFNAQQIYKTTNGGMSWDLADDDIYPIVTDIAMLNNTTGFMSARDFVYKTIDGGESWTKLHNDVQPSLTRMHVVNENIIWSGLNNGFVFGTINGGTDWEQINPNLIGSNQVFDVFATDNGSVWIPGKYASIQYSINNGTTWEDQTPGNKNALFDVEFRNSIGFAVGADGIILTTTNDGAIWQDISYDPDASYLCMSLYTAGLDGHIYIGTSDGRIVHRSLQNPQWENVGDGLGQIFSVYAQNTQTLFAGSFNTIYRTTNGGMMWTPVASTNNFVGEFAFPTDQIGYVAVQDGRVLKSVDGGASWNPVLERDNTYRFSGIHFENDMLGWAVAEFKDSVFTTEDGGATWNTFKLPSNTFWQDVQFMNADTGYISGGSAGSGTILRTTDGGEHWDISFSETERLNGMYVRPDEDYVWVVGFGGNILHFSPCAVTPTITNLMGDVSPCAGSSTYYEIESEGATLFNWTLPAGWTIIGNDNSARVEVLVGSGSGQISIQASNTCGTNTNILTIDVDPLPVEDVMITENGGVLSTTSVGVSYQWLLNNTLIAGAVSSSYTPTSSGAYALQIQFPNGCIAISNEITVTISGVRDVHTRTFYVYPNPATSHIIMKLPSKSPTGTIEVYDMHGSKYSAVMDSSGELNIEMLVPGAYMVVIHTVEAILYGKFVKE